MPDPNYPPVGFHFKVTFTDFQGEEEGNFQEVSGISVSVQTEEIKEGGENQFIHRLPSPPKYNNLVLKRGMFIGSTVTNWILDSLEAFHFTPTTVNVMLLDEEASPLYQWTFFRAYPVKLEVTGLKAMKEGEIVIETLELAYSYFKKA